MKSSPTRKQWVLIVTLAFATTPYFVRLGASSLWDSNESFYAETPREMVEAHDYINPTFNYRPRLNKPPLSYWIVIPFYKVFGVSETVERFPIVLGAMMLFAVIVMTAWTTESTPLWYRIAYFFVGPAAAFIGSALCSLRPHRS